MVAVYHTFVIWQQNVKKYTANLGQAVGYNDCVDDYNSVYQRADLPSQGQLRNRHEYIGSIQKKNTVT